jgi:hypothetical protein
MRKKCRKFERSVRASRRMRTGTPSCFETHRSGLGPWKRLRSGSAAMLLSMTARGARILAKRTQAGSMRASEGPTCGCTK